jgi:pyridoxamine 5'-phosphate oxidase
MPIDDPLAMFSALFERAGRECAEPNAMVLSTVDADGRPSARYMLLNGFDACGFVFYTNLGSRKARALAANPYAALTFYWPPLDKQVRVEGDVERVSEAEADPYFATRPRDSQIRAWASKQSTVLASPAMLDARIREISDRFDGAPVPRPPFWTGFRVVARSIEFWTRSHARLHERVIFSAQEWRVGTLAAVPVAVTQRHQTPIRRRP